MRPPLHRKLCKPQVAESGDKSSLIVIECDGNWAVTRLGFSRRSAREAVSMARRKHSKRSKAKTFITMISGVDYVTGNPHNKDVADTLSTRRNLPQLRPSTFSRE